MMSTMQGRAEISGAYLCLENAALSPRLLNVLPRRKRVSGCCGDHLAGFMLVIPFGSSDARVTAEHEDGTRTWRYEEKRHRRHPLCRRLCAGGD